VLFAVVTTCCSAALPSSSDITVHFTVTLYSSVLNCTILTHSSPAYTDIMPHKAHHKLNTTLHTHHIHHTTHQTHSTVAHTALHYTLHYTTLQYTVTMHTYHTAVQCNVPCPQFTPPHPTPSHAIPWSTKLNPEQPLDS
jgi:hypothetical protein